MIKKIFVRVKSKAKKESAEIIDATHFIVSVKEPVKQGRANKAVVKVLADFLNIAPSRLRIVKGRASKQKVIEIL